MPFRASSKGSRLTATRTLKAQKHQGKKCNVSALDSDSDSSMLDFKEEAVPRQLRRRLQSSTEGLQRRSTRNVRPVYNDENSEDEELVGSSKQTPRLVASRKSLLPIASSAQNPRHSDDVFEGQSIDDDGWYDIQILAVRQGRCRVLYENVEDEVGWLPIERIRFCLCPVTEFKCL